MMKKAENAIINTFDASPNPNQMMKIGKKASGGMGRKTSRIGSTMFSANRLEPERQPRSTPNTAAIRKPWKTRRRLMAISPGIRSRISQPASSICEGVGIMTAGTHCTDAFITANAHHAARNASKDKARTIVSRIFCYPAIIIGVMGLFNFYLRHSGHTSDSGPGRIDASAVVGCFSSLSS